ncbi:glycoside hydrolase family 15 protein [Brevibacillus antibioticus]|uniref:Glycoside hydrolase family 15 protein n=1 Tax=Brevibacillus antibioticus TaxID=2570228 RepID=A0A4U2Y3M7_9BACL|nr:glycoside hydrolase family 15 protein [Brevibacillus antibioticus]TKI54232.1 glycoside hydrolase family 15 protein [Brevibacillus antibioticus]
MTLIEESVKLILQHQASTGAYLASPAFVHYQYAWLRDGTFTAYAMNRTGNHESARRFYQWCDHVIRKHETKARAAITAVKKGLDKNDAGNDRFLHTRYTAEGEEVAGEWGSFQLDGYGTWLWGLAEHVRMSGEHDLIHKLKPSIELTIDYVLACWQLPNFDCWEEGGDRIHPVTLGAIYAGIKAMEPYLPDRAFGLAQEGETIRQFIREHGTANGQLIKSVGDHSVDASLLWLALPYGIVDVDDPLMIRTVQAIEGELCAGYGVHRYPADTYYGGGQWLLLSAWMGWYYVKTGRREEAEKIATWIVSQRQANGLPEQVQEHLLSPAHYELWVERAGHPAVPLLWSHAMFLVLAAELGIWH